MVRFPVVHLRITAIFSGRRREIDELEKYISKLREEKSALDKELLDNRSNTSAVNEEINKINAGLTGTADY